MPPTSFLRRRAPRTATALTPDARPLLAAGVAFEKGIDEAAWIVMLHGVPSSRVSGAVVDMLTALDGETPLHVLHMRFAAAESWENFLGLVLRFRASGLLDGATKLPPGRWDYRPPFTLQIATLRAPALFGRVDHLVVPLSGRAVRATVAVLLGLGLVAAILQAGELRSVLTSPMPLSGLVILVAVLSLLTLLHEGAHGLTLTRFGGRPRRAGFMIFYLTPAFFVDVTDGWRLPDRRQRVAIALAGPAVHAAVAAVALLVALALPDTEVRQTLVLLALACAAIVLVNLIPFVRFDGYIALMSALDEPNLRARTIRDGANSLTRFLFGGQKAAKSLNTWWSVPFGLASLIAPVVLVLFAVGRAARAVAGGGPVLGLLVVALEAVVVVVGVVLVSRALHRAFRSGVSRLRFFTVLAALVSTIAVAGVLIPVQVTATLGFSAQGGHVVLLHAGGAAETEVPEGARVVLMSSGILADERVGEGTVTRPRAIPTEVPLDALFPVTAEGVTLPAVIVAGVDLTDGNPRLPATGQARVELGVRNVWQSLWATGVTLPLATLQSERAEEDENERLRH
ncbi:daptide biosynthesis intramembrane metalloprotease [Microbacterium maritypicum]|uniref:daptide biosynthesis intramembrane metalloprotease n=1 Tax=Microbacterium maritypicum TaxID=33918 RepID=UPI000D9FDF07|nr:daptide biosynthesis intramembrane metalloprotease [Microbacterium liquefaciens]